MLRVLFDKSEDFKSTNDMYAHKFYILEDKLSCQPIKE